MNAYLLCSAAVGLLGSLLFGFNTAVMAGVTKRLVEVYRLSPGALGLTVSVALCGTVLGSVLAWRLGGRYARRSALGVLAVLYLVSAAGCAFAWNWPSLLLFRLVGGMAVGGSAVIGTLYLSETLPARIRSRLVVLLHVSVALGILLAYFSNYLLGLRGFGAADWRWKLGAAAVPAYLLLFGLFSVPESPSWLVRCRRPEEARAIIAELGEQDVDNRMKDLLASPLDQGGPRIASLFQGSNRALARVAISIGMFSQLAGTSVVLCYLNDLFERAGFSRAYGDVQAVNIGLTNLIVTLISANTMNRLGRKELLLGGCCGVAASLAAMAAIYQSGECASMLPFLLIMLIAFLAASQGSAIWVYVQELFPDPLRIEAQGLTLLVYLLMSALVSGVFPIMAASSTSIPFLFFALMTTVQFLVVLLIYPETTCGSTEELERKVDAVHP